MVLLPGVDESYFPATPDYVDHTVPNFSDDGSSDSQISFIYNFPSALKNPSSSYFVLPGCMLCPLTVAKHAMHVRCGTKHQKGLKTDHAAERYLCSTNLEATYSLYGVASEFTSTSGDVMSRVITFSVEKAYSFVGKVMSSLFRSRIIRLVWFGRTPSNCSPIMISL